MKKRGFVILVFVSVLLLLVTLGVVSAFSGSGSGTAGDPFQITSCSQLLEMNDSLSDSYTLVTNIDCNVAPFNTGAGFDPVGDPAAPFTGSLNGSGFNISNLHINRPSESHVGLFGNAGSGIIEQVGLLNVNITGGLNTGSLVGLKTSGTINNSFSSGKVNGSTDNLGMFDKTASRIPPNQTTDIYTTIAHCGYIASSK